MKIILVMAMALALLASCANNEKKEPAVIIHPVLSVHQNFVVGQYESLLTVDEKGNKYVIQRSDAVGLYTVTKVIP